MKPTFEPDTTISFTPGKNNRRFHAAPSGRRLARATGSASTGTVYYHGDHLGTARMETNASGTVIAQCTYAPFGQVVTCPTDDGANHYRFTGQERDAETGLDNFRAREFTSQFGRFSQPDPSGLAAVNPSNPQTWNRYAYTANNPINSIDPSGMFQCGWSYTRTVNGQVTQHQEDWEPCYADNYAGYTQALAMALNGVSPFGLGMMPCGYTGSGCRNQGGGGGGPTNQQTKPTPPKQALTKLCNALPSGRAIGVSSGLGLLGSVQGGLELVVNYSTGQVSGFAFGGGQAGWNGAASSSLYTGFIWGLSGSNSNYSGGFTGGSGELLVGGYAASSSSGLSGGAGGLLPNGKVNVVGMSLGSSLLGPTFGGTATIYSQPLQLGKFWGFTLVDWAIYLERKALGCP